MTDWLETIIRSGFVFGGVGIAVATLLVLANVVLLHEKRRRLVRLPALLLATALVAGVIRVWLPETKTTQRPAEVVAVFLLLTCIGRAGFVLVVDWLVEQRLHRPMPRIFREVIQAVIFFIVGLATLRAMGAEFGSLLTTSALLTAVLGLSLQETLGNLFAGLAIQAQRPFQVGDWIQLQGSDRDTIGRVKEINWRATHLVTNDQVQLVIPNGVLAKTPICNFTQPTPFVRRMIKLQGPYDVAPHLFERVLFEAARGCPGVAQDPLPKTWVSQYADSGIEYSLVYFIDDFARRSDIDSDVRRRCWYGLQRAGLSIPFPVRELRVPQNAESSSALGLIIDLAARASVGGRAGQTAGEAEGARTMGTVSHSDARDPGSVGMGAHGAGPDGASLVTAAAGMSAHGAGLDGALLVTAAAETSADASVVARARARSVGSAGEPPRASERPLAHRTACERMLRTVDFLDVLPDEALAQLAHDGRVCLFTAGEDIIRQGETGGELFILQSGEAVVLVRHGDGSEEAVEVARLKHGSVFGEMALVTGEPRSATVRAITVCELLVIHHDSFKGVLETNPDLLARISQVLASRQAQLELAHASPKVVEEHTKQSSIWMDRLLDFFSLRSREGRG